MKKREERWLFASFDTFRVCVWLCGFCFVDWWSNALYAICMLCIFILHARIHRAGVGVGVGGPDPPWKITKLPILHSMFGHHWPASETPFKRFAGGPMMAQLWTLTWKLCDFQGIRTSIAKKPIFLWFSGWGGGMDPCPPSGSAHELMDYATYTYTSAILIKCPSFIQYTDNERQDQTAFCAVWSWPSLSANSEWTSNIKPICSLRQNDLGIGIQFNVKHWNFRPDIQRWSYWVAAQPVWTERPLINWLHFICHGWNTLSLLD